MGVQRDAGDAVSSECIANNHVVRSAPRAVAVGKQTHSRAANLDAVVRGDVVGHRIVIDAEMRCVIRRSRIHRRMRRQNDAALQLVVFDGVVDKKIVVALCSLVANKDAVGVALQLIARHNGVRYPHQVKTATAVPVFIGLKGGLAGTATSHWIEDRPKLVVVHNVIAADGYVRRADHQNAFILCILDRKSGHGHMVETRIVVAIHIDAVGEAAGVNHGVSGSRAEERQGLSLIHISW